MPKQSRVPGAMRRRGSETPSTVAQPDPRSRDARQVHWGENEVHTHAQDAGNMTMDQEGEGAADADDDDELDSMPVPTNVLAITAAKGVLGCCYIDIETNKLSFLEDQRDSTEWDLCSLIVEQLLPTFVLTSTNADPAFLAALEDKLASLPLPPAPTHASSTTSNAETETGGNVRIEYRPARDFYSTAGKHALSRVKVLDRSAVLPATEEERQPGEMLDDRGMRYCELRLEAQLNNLIANPLTLGCAGALLEHIASARTRAGDLDAHHVELSGIELLKLSLQIFRDEAHASAHSRATKEGLSLFGIANLARTPLGKVKMRDWFLRPSLELDVIESRHDAVECFLREDNQHVLDSVRANLKHIKNTPLLLKKLRSGSNNLSDWQATWKLFYGAIMIRDALMGLSNRRAVDVVDKLAQSFDALAFKDLATMLNDVIDWNEGKLQNGRVCVRPGIDGSLDEMRRKYHGLGSLLSGVASEVSQDVPAGLAQELSVVYFPQLGYLVTIPHEEDETDLARFAELGWDFQFNTEAQAYFKNEKCRDLDSYVGDLQCFISDKEIEIGNCRKAHALLEHVLALESQMLAVTAVLAELEVLIAFAEAARLYRWTRPVMTEEPVCKIIEGRHPLAELCVDHFVSNNTSLKFGGDVVKEKDENEQDAAEQREAESNMLIVTGANFSGKSIYLKQVALIVYMAHIGCFVPAEDALIGLTDRIMTRVSTRESIARGSSAFMIDLQQISFALRNCTSRSLLLVDEFGKGTEPDDGAGLFCGMVEYLLAQGPEAPRTVIATHFQHVFLSGVLSRHRPFVLAHMEVYVEAEGSSAPAPGAAPPVEQLTYLYRLAPGLAVFSNALSCAATFGIPSEVLSRAAFVTDCLSTFQLDKLMLKAVDEMDEGEKAELKEAEEIARRLLEWDLDGGGREVEAEVSSADDLHGEIVSMLAGVPA
ncbi:hypothetical protein JCM8202v2_004590 [Rhodotorula sphaerocarpa]